MAGYGVTDFVDDLRAIAAETAEDKAVIRRVRPLARKLARDPGFPREDYYRCDPQQGFGVHLLHEEPDHSLAVFAVSWLPGRGVQPHDHGTWAVVVGVDGPERNITWRRLDDRSRPGYAEIAEDTTTVVGAGDAICFLPEDIHSVQNDSDQVTLSLHVYGKHVNHTVRSQYDPANRTEDRFQVKVA